MGIFATSIDAIGTGISERKRKKAIKKVVEIARQEAIEAKKDIAKIAEAIKKAVAAAKAVDRIVNVGIDLLA